MSKSRLGTYWSRRSKDFDAIYSGDRSRLFRLYDRFTRQNLRIRFEFAMDKLSPAADRRFLDVGCGSGRYCMELADRGAAEMVGVDLAGEMLELAQQRAQEHGLADICSFIEIDAMDYSSARGTFDGVIAMGLFDYVRQPAPFLRHIRTQVHGTLVASFPALWAVRTIPRKIWLNLRGCPVYYYTRAQIEQLCDRSGFSCVTLRRSGPIYLLEARAT